MTAPTITSGGVTFTFNEGDVENISSSLNANLDADSMPMTPPTDSLMFDFTGVIKSITLSGKLSNSGSTRLSTGTATTIDAQRQWLEKIVNGEQAGITFVSNYSSSYNGSTFVSSPCMIASMEFNEVTGEPASLQFRISLNVGAI